MKRIFRFLAVSFTAIALVASAASCSKNSDDEPGDGLGGITGGSGGGSSTGGSSVGNPSLVATWSLQSSYGETVPKGLTATVQFKKDGSGKAVQSYQGRTETQNFTWEATSYTITMEYIDKEDGEHGTTVIYYRLKGSYLYTYDDRYDYEHDADGSSDQKDVFKKK